LRVIQYVFVSNHTSRGGALLNFLAMPPAWWGAKSQNIELQLFRIDLSSRFGEPVFE